ncbi:MAG TPA: SUMF1/EgtB/PvdO family nonheme iron enzyme [Turneriella sp.]|nr:SUMF1/EgtB/PvdO family nonheme iron enzyme [Turneriella sp.]
MKKSRITSGFLMGWSGVATPLTTIPSITTFLMVQYEVQYGDWVAVKTWAASNGYTIINAGVQGNDGVGKTDQHPVTTISWRDAIVWCNAARYMSAGVSMRSDDPRVAAAAICSSTTQGGRLTRPTF